MSHLITTNVGQAVQLSVWRTYLNTGIAAGAIRVRLFKNNFVPDADTVRGDFTQADFTGYTLKSLTNPFGAVTTTAAGYAQIQSPDVLTWAPTDGLRPNTIYGYWLEDDTPTVYWCEKFDAPVDMTDATKLLNLICRYTAKSEY